MTFSTTTMEKLGTYVYELVNPTTKQVFYVGKGKGERVLAHERGKVEGQEGLKLKEISGIKTATGGPPEHRIVAYGLTQEEALLLEAVLIETHHIQRVPLSNVQSGHHAEDLYVPDEELETRFAPRLVKWEDVAERTLLVSLNGHKKVALPSYWAIRDDPEELARRTLGIWFVPNVMADQVELVAGVFHGVIRAVFRVEPDAEGRRWRVEMDSKGKRRKRFHGRAVPGHELVLARLLDADGRVRTTFEWPKRKEYAGPFVKR